MSNCKRSSSNSGFPIKERQLIKQYQINKTKLMKLLPILLIIICLFNPLSIDAQLVKGDRMLAWQVDMTENNDYDLALGFAEDACMESIHYAFNWSELEPDSGNFDSDFIANRLDLPNYYYPSKGIQVELQVAVTNTVAKEVPSDLIESPFSDPTLINRFKIALDTLFSHIPAIDLTALNIGNESDILFGSTESLYSEFKTFLDSVVPYAKSKYFDLYGKELKVGTTLTLDGLINPVKSEFCQNINSSLDIISVTYYPLAADFTMESPSVVIDDFSDLVSIYNSMDQPIYFAECGYASSETCNSSEALQAQFYSAVFSAWDEYYDFIKYITIFKSTDWSAMAVADFGAYYGIDDAIFLEYLRSLGVRTWDDDGENKLAYEFILCELNDREWCDVTCPLAEIEVIEQVSETLIFPNPTNHSLHISCEEKIDKIIIYNALGEQVLTTTESTLSVESFSAGIYYVHIQLADQSQEQLKFIKQ